MTPPPDLILHVGLPKTATTTMQRDAFPHYAGYLCGTESDGSSRVLARNFIHLYQSEKTHPEFGSTQWNLSANSWWEQLDSCDTHPRLVSLEGLYRWCDPVSGAPWPYLGRGRHSRSTRAGSHPLSGFLKSLSKTLETRIRVVFTVRNQADFAASLYAQLSYRIEDPSQRDFEKKVRQLASRTDPFLNWCGFSEDITTIVGRENFLCLVYEDGVKHNLKSIADFMGQNWKTPQTQEHHNKRSVSKDSWQSTKKSLLNTILTRAWPRPYASETRTYLKNSIARAFPRITRSKSEPIRVHPELRDLVQESYCQSNRQLGELLARNLPPSYYPSRLHQIHADELREN